jgi:magnesium-protoporphyrin O-methyltransferase
MSDRLREVDDAPDEPSCACDAGPSIGERIGAHFDSKVERAGPGTGSGLHAATQSILALLGDPADRTVLELGCGRGGLMVELLRGGAACATGVELSRASIEQAHARLDAAGLGDRSTIVIGDAAEVALEPADWVVLDRVICCYPDAYRLLTNSIPAARRRLAFSVPNSRGWRGLVARSSRWLDNSWNGLRGRPCATFVHDLDRMERTLGEAGFARHARATRGLWYVAVYERTTAGPI